MQEMCGEITEEVVEEATPKKALDALVALGENPEELRSTAAKLRGSGNEKDALRLELMANEAQTVADLEALKACRFEQSVTKWRDVPCFKAGLKQKVHRKMEKNRKFLFIPMNLSKLEAALGDDFEPFTAALYAYMNERRCEDISYFQPKIMMRIRRLEPKLIEQAREVASYYREKKC